MTVFALVSAVLLAIKMFMEIIFTVYTAPSWTSQV